MRYRNLPERRRCQNGELPVYARPAVISGGDGTQQRLRYGLGEHRPYRWHGIKGWNPAAVLDGWRSSERKTRRCRYCGTPAGEDCRSKVGQPMRTVHTGR